MQPQPLLDPVVPPETARKWLGLLAISVMLMFIATTVAASAPICDAAKVDSFLTDRQSLDHEPPYFCKASYEISPALIIGSLIWGPMVYWILQQFGQKTATQVNVPKYQCVMTWSLVLTSICLFWSFWQAYGVSTVTEGWYYCSTSCFSLNSHPDCIAAQQACNEYTNWATDAELQSVGQLVFFAFVSWLWMLFTLVGLIVLARLRYWCCNDCKAVCGPDPNEPNTCCTCGCCLGPLSGMGGANAEVPLMVGQGNTLIMPRAGYCCTGECRDSEYNVFCGASILILLYSTIVAIVLAVVNGVWTVYWTFSIFVFLTLSTILTLVGISQWHQQSQPGEKPANECHFQGMFVSAIVFASLGLGELEAALFPVFANIFWIDYYCEDYYFSYSSTYPESVVCAWRIIVVFTLINVLVSIGLAVAQIVVVSRMPGWCCSDCCGCDCNGCCGCCDRSWHRRNVGGNGSTLAVANGMTQGADGSVQDTLAQSGGAGYAMEGLGNNGGNTLQMTAGEVMASSPEV